MPAVGELAQSTTVQWMVRPFTALPARAPAAAGAHSGRVDRPFMRPAPDLAVRMRWRDVRATADEQCSLLDGPGNQWRDSGLVFTTELGGPLDRRNLLRRHRGRRQDSRCRRRRRAHLAPSAAVDWLESGVQIKAVADLPVRGIPGSRNAHGRRRVLINAQILRPAIVHGQAARRPVGSLAYWGLLSGRA